MNYYKRYAVQYSIVTHYEADILARSRVEATDKVIEVVGEPVKIQAVNQIKRREFNGK